MYYPKKSWHLAVYRGPSVTEGELGKNTKIEQYDTFNTKYRLLVTSRQYDISFIDNQSGSEIFTIDGRGCEPNVVDKFENALRGIDT